MSRETADTGRRDGVNPRGDGNGPQYSYAALSDCSFPVHGILDGVRSLYLSEIVGPVNHPMIPAIRGC